MRRSLGQTRRRWLHFWDYWVKPVLPLDRLFKSAGLYRRYLHDWQRYEKLPGAEPMPFEDSYPQLADATTTTGFDAHYFYQAVWAAEKVRACDPRRHLDVGSDVRFVSVLSVFTPVIFVDIRPLQAQLPSILPLGGDILNLPFADQSLRSISCLHVVEHIGLGRYGDPLNTQGSRLACEELERVLAPGGNLFLSLPIGRPRLSFNAHRVHTPAQVVSFFPDLNLVEFSAVDDQGCLLRNSSLEAMSRSQYACGLFWWQRPGS